MRLQRLVVFAATAILVAAVLTPMPPAAAQQATIVHWQHFHEGRAAALEGLIQVFQRNNPGLTVKTDLPPYEQYFDKLLASLATGSGPDVFQVPMEMAEQLINAGFLTPVPASVATTSEIATTFLPWTVDRFRRGNQYYGLPTDVQHLVLYINPDLARQAGLDPTKPPQTWDDLIAQARRATRRDAQGNIIQAGLDTRYKWAVYTALLYGSIEGPVVDAKNKKVTYTSPEGVAAWKLVEQLMRGPNAVDSPRFMTGQRKFENKRAVFYINHPVARSVIARIGPDIQYIVAPLPAIAGRKLVAPGHHWAYVVNAKSKNKEAAWKWVQFLGSRTAQKTWMQVAGDLPSALSLLTDPLMTNTPNDRAVSNSLKFVRPVDYVGNCDDFRDAVWDALALTATPVEQLLTEAAAKENSCVADALK